MRYKEEILYNKNDINYQLFFGILQFFPCSETDFLLQKYANESITIFLQMNERSVTGIRTDYCKRQL